MLDFVILALFFGIAMGEGAAGVFAGFPAKGNPPD